MKKYDILVVGSGSGMIIVEEALEHGMKVALVDKGPLGGTCLNVGCIPSKMLIYPADRIVEIQESEKLGIKAEVLGIDFASIMKRMREVVAEGQEQVRNGIASSEELDFYEGEGHFIDEFVMEVNGEQIKADKIFLASGSRLFIPPIKGLDKVDFLTNESLLNLEKPPDSLIIVGGGYIGVEYGHFFAAMGTKVTILEMTDRLVLSEEPEMSNLLEKKLSQRMTINTNSQTEEVKYGKEGVIVISKDVNTGIRRELTAQNLMMAVGRKSNADLLMLEKTGVKTDKRGYIIVNNHLETSKKNIYAVGDANGEQMFTHAANREALLAINNVLHNANFEMDYNIVPHAVFSHPQIASIGMTEEKARKDHDVLIGRASYTDTARGEAMVEKEGFAKAVVEKDSGKILGFHIAGPHASILIQEVANVMASGGNSDDLHQGIHIHPALPELITVALNSLEE